MNISQEYRKMLADEIKSVRKKMKEENDLRRKMFYYSAIQHVVNRIFNIQYDPRLIFMHFVFQGSYGVISNCVNALAAGVTLVPISPDFFKRLDDVLLELEETLRKKRDDEIPFILEKILCLTYLTTGNGYYLSQMGVELLPEKKKKTR